MEVQGKLKVIRDAQTFGTFTKREMVVTTNDQYPQDLLIEMTQDKCSLLDKYKIGDNIEVGVNLRGREWINPKGEAVYFNTIQGWKISKLEGGTPPQDLTPLSNLESDEVSDMPF